MLGFAIVGIVGICDLCQALATANNDVIATLSLPKTVLQGEPLPIIIRVENRSTQDRCILIPVIRRFGPDTVLFRVQVPGDDQKKSIQRPDIYVGGFKNMPPAALPVKRLSPGESVEYAFSLIYDFPDVKRRKRLFDAPGKYVVQATVFELVEMVVDVVEVPYDAQRCAVETGSVSVEIVPPENRRDKEALNAMWNLPDEYLVYDPFVFRADCHAESVKKMKEYFSNYSDTKFGQRAALPLGIAIADGVISDDSGVIRKTIESLSLQKQSQLHSTAGAVLEEISKRKR